MEERAQATVEYVGIGLVVLLLLIGGSAVARAQLTSHPTGDTAYLTLAAQHVPRFVAESGDGEHPVDFRRCRDPACARTGRPMLYVHGLRRGGYTYLEYWEYLPESRTAHTGIAPLDGYHLDDWEGLIVKLRSDGFVVGARASAHLGWNGRHPWWELRRADWAPYPTPVYRASGSHAGALRTDGIDLAGDRWDGSTSEPAPALMPADQARRGAPAFDPGATPPWTKAVWSDPEAVTTGPPGSNATYARYARWWADLCLLC
jgi:hypothetical protein